MQLEVDGQERTFIPLKLFQARFNLPDEFGSAYFEKKDWDIGSLNGGAEALSSVKKDVTRIVPSTLTLTDLLHQPEQLAATFRTSLEAVNLHIGLTQVQLDFAVDGLHNLLLAVVYELVRLHHLFRGDVQQIQATFDFTALYRNWLNQSVSIFGQSYDYHHEGLCFEIKTISYLYGRMGLRIENAGEVYYVADSTLACPAAGFMGDLAEALALALCRAANVPVRL
ncbi:MAG: hypothetical protein KDF65_07475 [Anaerolineae bacterium]|nr:hypothetical protein [Anaerolineae bacterium]